MRGGTLLTHGSGRWTRTLELGRGRCFSVLKKCKARRAGAAEAQEQRVYDGIGVQVRGFGHDPPVPETRRRWDGRLEALCGALVRRTGEARMEDGGYWYGVSQFWLRSASYASSQVVMDASQVFMGGHLTEPLSEMSRGAAAAYSCQWSPPWN